MKKIFVAVGSTASDAVIELAKRCRDENLDEDGMLARDFKYITMDTDKRVKARLEGLYPDSTRVCGIHITHEAEGSPVLNSLLAVRKDWENKLKIDPFGAYGLRRKTAGTRKWVANLRQIFRTWNIDLQTEEMEILVVGTACGATCTGMYWDVAGCLRAWSNQRTTVCGVVCLPDLDETPIQTPDGLYPIPRNFCAFMQDMRQIAILNSLNNSQNGGGGRYFRPVSLKEINADAASNRWEDCQVPIYDNSRDLRSDTSRLPVDAMFFLPPRVDDAKRSFADHLFVYAAIYHYSGPGGQADMGNAANRGGVFGGLDLAVATSPLFNAVKKRVQDRWQDIRSGFLKTGERAAMDVADQETLAGLIRPPTDAFTDQVKAKLREADQWFAGWKANVLAGKPLELSLEVIMQRLHSLIKDDAFPAYLKENPIPLKFLGKDSFIEKVNSEQNTVVWELVVRETGREVTLQDLKAVYVGVCKEIKDAGGATSEELAQKTKGMSAVMEQAQEALEMASDVRTSKMAVKAFGQGGPVRAELAKSFNKWADDWYQRLKVIYLMHYLAQQLPGEERLDREISNYMALENQATCEVVNAPIFAELERHVSVTRQDILKRLFNGMKEYDEVRVSDDIKDGYKKTYEDFVSDRVAGILSALGHVQTFDKAPFTPRFQGRISGYSSVFRREDTDTERSGLVKHICKHAGDVQKPTYKAVNEFSESFKGLKRDATDNDSFDPFATQGQVAGRITSEPEERRRDCYFGALDQVPPTFLRMWLGVLALDKSLPELMSQIYSLNKRQSIQDTAMDAETGAGGPDFVRLMNLRESVELGVVLGHLTKMMKEQELCGRIGGVHLKRKADGRELVTWTQQQVSAFWENGDLRRTDIRTLQRLLAWLRELNVQSEAREHLQFWNEKDWNPLSDNTFMFDNRPEYMAALADLESFLCGQLEVTFDPYQVG